MEYPLLSRQRLNFLRHGVLAAETPVFQQFLSMHHRPFPNQIQSPAWQFAFEDLQGANLNCGFEFAVAGVKMRRRVIIEERESRSRRMC
jgi:hypothetical protein